MRSNLSALLAVLLLESASSVPAAPPAIYNLGALGGTSSRGADINGNGQVTGTSYTAGNKAQHAFLYTGTPGSGGVMHDLGTLGGNNSAGYDVNASGQVVGWSNVESNAIRAFAYIGTPGVDGRMIDLDSWLDAVDPIEGAKWTLTEANGLNDNGLITGSSEYNDSPGGLSDGTRAYVLDASSLLAPQPGDFDGDGAVDGDDLTNWKSSFGAIVDATHAQGDADGDLDVDGADFLT